MIGDEVRRSGAGGQVVASLTRKEYGLEIHSKNVMAPDRGKVMRKAFILEVELRQDDGQKERLGWNMGVWFNMRDEGLDLGESSRK